MNPERADETRRRAIFCFAALLLLFSIAARAAAAGVPRPEAIERMEITRLPVFPETTATPLPWILRFANKLHRTTREGVIRREILFREGALLDSLRLAESERLLRNRGIFESAEITSSPGDSASTVTVQTQDLWSLALQLSFEKQADITELTVGVEESNILGTGNELRWTQLFSTDQGGLLAAARVPRLGATRATALLFYSDMDDGQARSAYVGRLPETVFDHWGWGISATALRQRQRFYHDGELSGRSRYERESYSISFGRYSGRELQGGFGIGWAERRLEPLGQPVTYAEDLPPPPSFERRRHGGPLIHAGMLRRTFRTTENLDRYGTVEDRPVGWAVQGTAGPNLRFREDSTRAFAAQGFLGAAAFPLRTVGVSLEAAGSLFLRHDRSAGERTIRAVGTITWQPNRRWLSLLQSAILTGADRPATSVVYIGTGNGLRGFPARAFEARSYALVTFEQRFWTGIEVLWTGIGMNLFLDGALPSDGRLQDGEHWRSGCGAGLLLGFKKSLQKPIRIEVAWRTDRRADPTLSISMRTPLRIIPAILFPSPTARFAEIAR